MREQGKMSENEQQWVRVSELESELESELASELASEWVSLASEWVS